MRHTWCAHPAPDWLFPGDADATALRSLYGAPLDVVRSGHAVIAQKPSSRELYRLEAGGWTQIGAASRRIVDVDGSLYRLSDNGDRVELYSAEDGGLWTAIGGMAGDILRCGRFLCSIDPRTGVLYRYGNPAWSRLGAPARRYDSMDSMAIRVIPDGRGVEIYDEAASSWKLIGFTAGLLYAGPRYAYATEPEANTNFGNLWRWDPQTGGWGLVAIAARQFVETAEGLAAVTSTGDAVWWLPFEPPTPWMQIGGEYLRIAGRQELYAVAADGTVLRFLNGNWTSLGAP
jgi:hypothetical protein